MGSKKTVNILGATGSIGESTVDLILSSPEMFEVNLITANKNRDKLLELKDKLNAKYALCPEDEGFEEALSTPVDLTVSAITGFAGLKPLMIAIEHSKAVAIANKEPLVAAGPQVLDACKKHSTQILPIDSEHNAIFQVFDKTQKSHIERIILTASGGPFRAWSKDEIDGATVEQALKHPNWDMGQKITIDSATMMNKGLEVIEAHYLFGLPAEQIDVLIHPQSVVHSMVEYADGSVLAQMGASDMRTPIAYALAWPERMKTSGQTLDFKSLKQLSFEEPDDERFPALALSYQCLEKGQAACIALNAANEIAVEAFLENKISFPFIVDTVKAVVDQVENSQIQSLEDVFHLDHIYRDAALRHIQSLN